MCTPARQRRQHGWTCSSSHVGQFFMLFTRKSPERESKARRATSRTTHTRCSWWSTVSFLTRTLCASVFQWAVVLTGLLLMCSSRVMVWQVVPTCRGWSYSSLEKLVRRIKHGESAPASSGGLECMQTSCTGWKKTSRQTRVSPGPIWPSRTSAHATRFDASCQTGASTHRSVGRR